MTKDEALHKALKVLNCLNNDRVYETAWVKGAINACEEALERPAQEPVTLIKHENGNYSPKHQWQGLTDDEVRDVRDRHKGKSWIEGFWAFYVDIEQALKEKNT
jgi:hypothetical protein